MPRPTPTEVKTRPKKCVAIAGIGMNPLSPVLGRRHFRRVVVSTTMATTEPITISRATAATSGTKDVQSRFSLSPWRRRIRLRASQTAGFEPNDSVPPNFPKSGIKRSPKAPITPSARKPSLNLFGTSTSTEAASNQMPRLDEPETRDQTG
jgi:hypothetical protein